MSDWNAEIIAEFRENSGIVSGVFEGRPLLLLHTTGAKTGEPRVHPLMYQQLEEGVAIFASKAGAARNPSWYHNLVANPTARIEIGIDTRDVTARIARGTERNRIWERQKREYPFFAEYDQKTSRDIPVIVLEERTT